MKISAGILFVLNDKVLLAHSTNSPWWCSYTPPKGGVEKGESLQQAASREVHEEVGIYIDPDMLNEKIDVEYRTPSGKLYKIVHLFIHRIKSLHEIGLADEHIPFSNLQKEEIDEAKFMDIENVKKKLLPRYLPHILSILQNC